MPDINDLIPDMLDVLGTPQGVEKADAIALDIATSAGHRLRRALNRQDRPREKGVLYPAELGHPCGRKTWYDFNYNASSMLAIEPISPTQKLKFFYGDVIESLVVPLAQASGHKVECVDTKVDFGVLDYPDWIVRGKIDLVVDGHVVDVKSMAARSFDAWDRDGVRADKFGYSAQVSSYQYALDNQEDGYVLAVDKEGGKMRLHKTERSDVQRLAAVKADAAMASSPSVLIGLLPVADGKSGNMKLQTTCAYCKYKYECWKDSNGGVGLRKFNYSYGPVWLTEVAREPRVEEAT